MWENYVRYRDRMDWDDAIFMLPGPVKMHPRVIRAMAVPARAHRDKDYYDVIEEIKGLLKYLYQTRHDVILLSSSGTGAMDAAISNLLRKDDKVLCIHNGKFGQRFYEICKVFASPVEYRVEWGKAPDIEKVKENLETEEFRAVTLCYNESSTALTNPGEEIGKLVKKYDAFFIVDGITAVGGLDISPEKLNADALVVGSQKCIAAPAGLATISLSPRYIEEMHDESTYYFNLRKALKKWEKNDTPWTSAIPLFFAMHEALLLLKEEGITNRIKRTRRLAEATRAAVKAIGLYLFPDDRYASDTLTGVWYPEGIDDKNFRGLLKEEYRIIIAGAQEHIKGKVFRIGHMGIVGFNDLIATIGAIEVVLNKLGYKCDLGAGVAEVLKYM